jgi:hypothetical protein
VDRKPKSVWSILSQVAEADGLPSEEEREAGKHRPVSSGVVVKLHHGNNMELHVGGNSESL